MIDDEGRSIEVHEIIWNGITIEIRYERNWLNSPHNFTAHLEIEAVKPPRASLPITDTGYKSHFTSPHNVTSEGGPVPFVVAWLKTMERSVEWRSKEMARRQPDLFG